MMMGDGNLEKPHPEEGNNKGEEGLNNTDDLIQRRASLDSLDLTQSDGVANYLRPQRLSVSALDLPSWDDWQQDFDEDTRSVALQRAGEVGFEIKVLYWEGSIVEALEGVFLKVQ